MAEQGAAAATGKKKLLWVYSCKHCRLAKTRREYWTPGLGPIVVNGCKPGLLDCPSYRFMSIINPEPKCADGAGTTTKMVPADDGEHIPATYGELVETIGKHNEETLPPHMSTDRAIHLKSG